MSALLRSLLKWCAARNVEKGQKRSSAVVIWPSLLARTLLGLCADHSRDRLTFRTSPNEAHIARAVTPRNPTGTLLDSDRICMSEGISWNAD